MTGLANNVRGHSAAHAATELLCGDLLDGKYRLDMVLGTGAMGQVWRARNVLLDLPVAIKIVRARPHGREAMQRLLTEARFEAQLQHPNVVRVHDVRADADMAYVVMELLEGCTLADLMDEGPLPTTLAVRLTLPLLDALCAAHQAGIVHRDIKPENIFIARGAGGRVYPKLLDFGIARSDAAEAGQPHPGRVVMGTPGYMSPEQAWGEERVDERADIWALGVVLYEAICGESAFACVDYVGFLRALEQCELTPLPGEGGAELWKIVARATTKAWEQRFASSLELAQALRGFLRDRGVFEDLSGDSLPEHWATPGSLIHRAWRRAGRNDTWTSQPLRPAHAPLPRAASQQVTAERLAPAASAPRVQRRARPSALGGVRGIPWKLAAAAAGALAGVTMALLFAPGKSSRDASTAQAPAVIHDISLVAKNADLALMLDQVPSERIVPASTVKVSAKTPAYSERKPKKAAPKRVGGEPKAPAPRDESLDRAPRRTRARRAYAANARTEATKGPISQRETTALNTLKSW